MEADDGHVHITVSRSPKEKKEKIVLEFMSIRTNEILEPLVGV